MRIEGDRHRKSATSEPHRGVDREQQPPTATNSIAINEKPVDRDGKQPVRNTDKASQHLRPGYGQKVADSGRESQHRRYVKPEKAVAARKPAFIMMPNERGDLSRVAHETTADVEMIKDKPIE